jgi:hypothetical protein
MSPVYAQFGYTALMTASTHGREGCVRLLLESEAIEVNATEVSLERALPQVSPKHMPWVSFHVVISVVSCLQNLGYTALHCAAYWGRLAITELLLELGADPTLRSKEGKTALDYAREEGKSEVVALLSEPRYADEDRPTNATRTQRPRRLGHTPSTDCWPTAKERRRLAMGCCREDATADLPRR